METKDANGYQMVKEIIRVGQEADGGYTDYVFPDVYKRQGLDMTRFFMWMSLDVPLQSLRRNRKIRSATGERRCAP